MSSDRDEADSNRVYLSVIAMLCKPMCAVSRTA